MEAQTVYCEVCQHAFRAPVGFQGQGKTQAYYCEECMMNKETLTHQHNLSLDISSLEDLNTVTQLLLQVGKPMNLDCTSRCSCVSRVETYEALYWLSCSYDQVSTDLLHSLASLSVHFTLHDVQTRTDSLYFWPGDKAPAGTLAFLLDRAALS